MDMFYQRRSVRGFADKAIDPAFIREMKEVFLLAPTGKIQMKTKVKFVTDHAKIVELSRAGSAQEFVAGSKLIIVFTKDQNEQPGTPLEDIAIAVSHLQLYCVQKGLGSCWVHLAGIPCAEGGSNEAYVYKVCELPETLLPHCMLVIGYPADKITPKVVDVASSNRFI